MHTSHDVCAATGASYRQLDHWDRAGVVSPSIPARGSGSRRTYTTEDVRLVRLVVMLARVGCPSSTIRLVVDAMRGRPADVWTGTLIIGPTGRIYPPSVPVSTAAWVINLDACVPRRGVCEAADRVCDAVRHDLVAVG